MSKIINESTIYPGWEIPETGNMMQEKALLISMKQNLIFRFVNIGTMFGILTGLYMIVSTNDEVIISNILTQLFLYSAGGTTAGAIAGVIIANLRKNTK